MIKLIIVGAIVIAIFILILNLPMPPYNPDDFPPDFLL